MRAGLSDILSTLKLVDGNGIDGGRMSWRIFGFSRLVIDLYVAACWSPVKGQVRICRQ